MKSYRLLQTVLFLTNSVFRVLFAYFDESMGSIGGYEPWRSWNTVGLHQYKSRMSSLQYLEVVFCFLSLTKLTRFSVKFCVVKFSSFWVKL